MDTELARTFLTVVTAGNFIAAAERLHVSQSTVSTRIHTLEQQLGCTLFVRNKAGATLTPAGRQFQRHASALVRTVEQARQDVGIPKGFSGTLVVGGRIGLWEEYLLQWLPLMQAANPEILDPGRKRTRAGDHAGAGGRAHRYRRDVHTAKPPRSQGRAVVRRATHSGVDRSEKRPEPQPGYVYVDWGPEFYARHSAFFPNFTGPSLTANIGWLGLQHVLDNGGSGFFARRIVEPLLKTRRLHAVAGAPEFSMPAYVVYPLDRQDDHVSSAIELMHRIADVQRQAAQPPSMKRGARKRR